MQICLLFLSFCILSLQQSLKVKSVELSQQIMLSGSPYQIFLRDYFEGDGLIFTANNSQYKIIQSIATASTSFSAQSSLDLVCTSQETYGSYVEFQQNQIAALFSNNTNNSNFLLVVFKIGFNGQLDQSLLNYKVSVELSGTLSCPEISYFSPLLCLMQCYNQSGSSYQLLYILTNVSTSEYQQIYTNITINQPPAQQQLQINYTVEGIIKIYQSISSFSETNIFLFEIQNQQNTFRYSAQMIKQYSYQQPYYQTYLGLDGSLFVINSTNFLAILTYSNSTISIKNSSLTGFAIQNNFDSPNTYFVVLATLEQISYFQIQSYPEHRQQVTNNISCPIPLQFQGGQNGTLRLQNSQIIYINSNGVLYYQLDTQNYNKSQVFGMFLAGYWMMQGHYLSSSANWVSQTVSIFTSSTFYTLQLYEPKLLVNSQETAANLFTPQNVTITAVSVYGSSSFVTFQFQSVSQGDYCPLGSLVSNQRVTYPHLSIIVPNSKGPAVTFQIASVEHGNVEYIENPNNYEVEVVSYEEFAFNYYCKQGIQIFQYTQDNSVVYISINSECTAEQPIQVNGQVISVVCFGTPETIAIALATDNQVFTFQYTKQGYCELKSQNQYPFTEYGYDYIQDLAIVNNQIYGIALIYTKTNSSLSQLVVFSADNIQTIFPDITPRALFSDEIHYNGLLFVDNIVSLIMIQYLGNNFSIYQTYPYLLNNTVLCELGLLAQGIFIFEMNSTGSTAAYILDKQQINQIQVQNLTQYQSILIPYINQTVNPSTTYSLFSTRYFYLLTLLTNEFEVQIFQISGAPFSALKEVRRVPAYLINPQIGLSIKEYKYEDALYFSNFSQSSLIYVSASSQPIEFLIQIDFQPLVSYMASILISASSPYCNKTVYAVNQTYQVENSLMNIETQPFYFTKKLFINKTFTIPTSELFLGNIQEFSANCTNCYSINLTGVLDVPQSFTFPTLLEDISNQKSFFYLFAQGMYQGFPVLYILKDQLSLYVMKDQTILFEIRLPRVKNPNCLSLFVDFYTEFPVVACSSDNTLVSFSAYNLTANQTITPLYFPFQDASYLYYQNGIIQMVSSDLYLSTYFAISNNQIQIQTINTVRYKDSNYSNKFYDLVYAAPLNISLPTNLSESPCYQYGLIFYAPWYDSTISMLNYQCTPANFAQYFNAQGVNNFTQNFTREILISFYVEDSQEFNKVHNRPLFVMGITQIQAPISITTNDPIVYLAVKSLIEPIVFSLQFSNLSVSEIHTYCQLYQINTGATSPLYSNRFGIQSVGNKLISYSNISFILYPPISEFPQYNQSAPFQIPFIGLNITQSTKPFSGINLLNNLVITYNCDLAQFCDTLTFYKLQDNLTLQIVTFEETTINIIAKNSYTTNEQSKTGGFQVFPKSSIDYFYDFYYVEIYLYSASKQEINPTEFFTGIIQGYEIKLCNYDTLEEYPPSSYNYSQPIAQVASNITRNSQISQFQTIASQFSFTSYLGSTQGIQKFQQIQINNTNLLTAESTYSSYTPGVYSSCPLLFFDLNQVLINICSNSTDSYILIKDAIYSFQNLIGNIFPNVNEGIYNNYTGYFVLSNMTNINVFSISTTNQVPNISQSIQSGNISSAISSYTLFSANNNTSNQMLGLLLVYVNNSLAFIPQGSSEDIMFFNGYNQTFYRQGDPTSIVSIQQYSNGLVYENQFIQVALVVQTEIQSYFLQAYMTYSSELGRYTDLGVGLEQVLLQLDGLELQYTSVVGSIIATTSFNQTDGGTTIISLYQPNYFSLAEPFAYTELKMSLCKPLLALSGMFYINQGTNDFCGNSGYFYLLSNAITIYVNVSEATQNFDLDGHNIEIVINLTAFNRNQSAFIPINAYAILNQQEYPYPYYYWRLRRRLVEGIPCFFIIFIALIYLFCKSCPITKPRYNRERLLGLE